MLYFGKRGRENTRLMAAEDIQIHKSSSGLEYITLIEKASNNHQKHGGSRIFFRRGCTTKE